MIPLDKYSSNGILIVLIKNQQNHLHNFFRYLIRYNHKEPIATKLRENIMKAVDFGALKNMLGK